MIWNRADFEGDEMTSVNDRSTLKFAGSRHYHESWVTTLKNNEPCQRSTQHQECTDEKL